MARWPELVISWQEGVPRRNLLLPTFPIPLPPPTPGTRIQDNDPLRFDRTRTHDANISTEVNASSELWSCDLNPERGQTPPAADVAATFRNLETNRVSALSILSIHIANVIHNLCHSFCRELSYKLRDDTGMSGCSRNPCLTLDSMKNGLWGLARYFSGIVD